MSPAPDGTYRTRSPTPAAGPANGQPTPRRPVWASGGCRVPPGLFRRGDSGSPLPVLVGPLTLPDRAPPLLELDAQPLSQTADRRSL